MSAQSDGTVELLSNPWQLLLVQVLLAALVVGLLALDVRLDVIVTGAVALLVVGFAWKVLRYLDRIATSLERIAEE